MELFCNFTQKSVFDGIKSTSNSEEIRNKGYGEFVVQKSSGFANLSAKLLKYVKEIYYTKDKNDPKISAVTLRYVTQLWISMKKLQCLSIMTQGSQVLENYSLINQYPFLLRHKAVQ